MSKEQPHPRRGAVLPATGRVVDRIDEMVDGQLVAGEPHQGHDFGDPTFPRCPHCVRHWHGLPITERIAAMYALGRFDDDYEFAADDSRILCEGSDFVGPMPSEADAYTYTTAPEWFARLIEDAARYVTTEIGTVLGVPAIEPHVLREMIEQPMTGTYADCWPRSDQPGF